MERSSNRQPDKNPLCVAQSLLVAGLATIPRLFVLAGYDTSLTPLFVSFVQEFVYLFASCLCFRLLATLTPGLFPVLKIHLPIPERTGLRDRLRKASTFDT